MFEKLKKSKTSLIVLALVCVLALGYWMMNGEDSPSQRNSGGGDLVGQELLTELERLRSLNQMDVKFFDDPVWASLEDTTVPVVPQPIGRQNPFAPAF